MLERIGKFLISVSRTSAKDWGMLFVLSLIQYWYLYIVGLIGLTVFITLWLN